MSLGGAEGRVPGPSSRFFAYAQNDTREMHLVETPRCGVSFWGGLLSKRKTRSAGILVRLLTDRNVCPTIHYCIQGRKKHDK